MTNFETDWNALKANLTIIAETTNEEAKRNKALSAIENAQIFRECGDMLKGLNEMTMVLHAIG